MRRIHINGCWSLEAAWKAVREAVHVEWRDTHYVRFRINLADVTEEYCRAYQGEGPPTFIFDVEELP